MPPSEMTATSVVPPPMSTMSDPDGSLTGSPAPIAAAIGSSISRAQRAPELSAASRTARFSTSVTPDGMPSSIRGRGIRPTRSCTLFTKYLIICSVTSKSLMTPSRSGRTAMIEAGRAADHALGLRADRQDPLGLGVDGHDRRLGDHDPAVADVHERVRRAEVDPDVAGEEAEESVEHEGEAVPCWCRAGRRRPDGRRPDGRAGVRGRVARARSGRAGASSIPAPPSGPGTGLPARSGGSTNGVAREVPRRSCARWCRRVRMAAGPVRDVPAGPRRDDSLPFGRDGHADRTGRRSPVDARTATRPGPGPASRGWESRTGKPPQQGRTLPGPAGDRTVR